MDCTVVILTKNAGETLERTLQSVDGFAQSILLIDDYSADTTHHIARNYGCKVITHSMETFGLQRAFALTQVNTEWTLILDSDEVLTKENKKEIIEAMQKQEFNGYFLQFRNHLFGKKLLHGELHKKLVLFRTKQASISAAEVHEHYEVKGKLGTLTSEVLHYSYRSAFQIVQKFFSYSILQAKQYKKDKQIFSFRKLLLNPPHMFYARYFKDEGYKDGVARLFLDLQFAKMEFLSYFLIPFVKERKRISVDCGSYPVGGIVQSGIDRLLQGIYSHKSETYDYYWFSFSKYSSKKLPIRFFSQFWLPLKTILNRCDIFLGTAGVIPEMLRFFPIKKIVFLHDFGFFSSPEKYDSSSWKLQMQTENSIKIADKIVVFHSEIYGEFIKRYPQYSYKAVIIPAGADHLESVDEESIALKFDKPFALFVGVVKPVKRIDRLLSAIGDMNCVIAGPQEEKYFKSLHIGKTQNIQFIKSFTDNQLKWLYKNAQVLIYTSEHEGFCYPVLEALSLGLPVIAFDLPLFREYKKYFKYLKLVANEEDLKRELQSMGTFKHTAPEDNPYKWETFNSTSVALWQPKWLPQTNNLKIAFIFVLYKTPEKEVKRLTQEITSMGLPSYSIYWIDNTTNGAGYAGGINEGIRKGLIDNCDVFIALNPDISFKQVTAEHILAISQEFAVWGFGMNQNKVVYYGGEIDTWRLSGGLVKNKPIKRFSTVDFISGSVMGFSKQVVQTIGLWSEEYFMYYEDVDYCLRAQRAGFQVGIDSGVMYDHFEISQINASKEKWIASSRWKFFWKYSNLLQKMRELIRLPKTIVGL